MGGLKHVIVGAGPAGLSAVEAIRRSEKEATITLIADEPPYSRMAIPYYLAGAIGRTALVTADDGWLAQQGVERVGARACAIEPSAGRVNLEDGSSVAYDRLLIATGSSAVRPRIPGIEEAGVLNMWKLSDADEYLQRGGREVAILGAGFIGLVILDALVRRGAKVTFVELAPSILSRMLDREAADILEAELSRRGVRFCKGTTAEMIERRGSRLRIALSGDGSLECDVLVAATGIKPNVEFLAGSGLEMAQGILVDSHLRTSLPQIYAAGDVAQGPELLTGERVVHAIQPTAVDHGYVAGVNMAGGEAVYPGSLSMNIVDALGLQACSFGLWEGTSAEVTAVANRADGIYRKYVWKEDRLVGGVLVGPSPTVCGVNDAGMLRGLIQAKLPLGAWKRYLQENPLDLRRPFVASGAAGALVAAPAPGCEWQRWHLDGARGGLFRPSGQVAARVRSPHHAVFLVGAP